MEILEKLVPGFATSREIERKNRALAFAGIRTTVAGTEICPITPRTRLELQLLRNAFTLVGSDPLLGDVFEFFWVHHPGRLPLTGWRGIVSRWRQRTLGNRLRAPKGSTPHQKERHHAANVRAVREYLAEQLQDMPEPAGEADGIDRSGWIHWVAQDAGFWINVHGGFTLESYLGTPMLVLQQLYRVWQCNHAEIERNSGGDFVRVEPEFRNASDRLADAWLVERREAAGRLIREQRHRLA